MLKRRLILALTINDGQLCRTKHFRPDRTYSMDFVDLDGADELVIIDVSASGGERGKFLGVVEKLSQELFLPLAVGGHVDSWDYARDLMNAGADKIILDNFGGDEENEGEKPYFNLIDVLAGKLGSSCIVARLTQYSELSMADGMGVACILEDAGVGEILFQDLMRDGSLLGYDVKTIQAIAGKINIPVIAMSGCGTPQHMIEGFQAGASACATSNIFHFTSTHVRRFRETIQKAGIDMRPV